MIQNPTNCIVAEQHTDCPSASTYSFHTSAIGGSSITVSGTRLDLSIDDVLAAEGLRSPAWPEAQTEISVAFLLLKRPGETLTEEVLDKIDRIVDSAISNWERMTDERGSLVNKSAIPAPTPGDYNQNGVVDAADYTLWRDNLGTTNVLPNDALGGTIGQGQYTQWKTNFGNTNGTGSTSSVPEPASLVLALFISLLIVVHRHRC